MQGSLESIQQFFAAQPDVELAYVFGSLAKGSARSASDLDVAIQTRQPLSAEQRLDMLEALAALTGRPVDLVDVTHAGEPLLGEILTHGKRIKGTDNHHVRLVQRHIYDTEDFLPTVRRLMEARRQQWIN